MRLSNTVKTHTAVPVSGTLPTLPVDNIGRSHTEMRDWGDLALGDATAVNLPVSNPLKMVELLGEARFRDGRIVV